MPLSAFTDPDDPPDAVRLAAVLAGAEPAWLSLSETMRAERPGATEAWAYPGRKYGWSMRLKEGERILAYLTPGVGDFLLGLVLGERAIDAARADGLSPAAEAHLADAPRYAEGRGVRLTVATDGDLPLALELARIKLRS